MQRLGGGIRSVTLPKTSAKNASGKPAAAGGDAGFLINFIHDQLMEPAFRAYHPSAGSRRILV